MFFSPTEVVFRVVELPVDQVRTHLLKFLGSSKIKERFKIKQLVNNGLSFHVKMATLSVVSVRIESSPQDGFSQIKFIFNFSRLILSSILSLTPFLFGNIYFAFIKRTPITLNFTYALLFLYSAFLLFYFYRNKRIQLISTFLETLELSLYKTKKETVKEPQLES